MARSRKNSSTVNHAVRQAWRTSRGGLVALVIFSTFINVLKFAMPLYLLQVLDRVPSSRSVETLAMLTAVVVLAVLSAVILNTVRKRMLTRWGVWIEEQFSARLFEDGVASGKLGESLTVQQSLGDLSKLRTFVSRSVATWLDIVWAPVFIFGVYLVDPLLGVIALSAIGLLMVLGFLRETFTRESRRAARDASTEAGEIVSSAERNMETIGALSMSTNLAERWRRSTAIRLIEVERSDGRDVAFSAAITGLGQCVRIAMIAVGIWLVLQNVLTIGAIFAARVMLGSGYRLIERAVLNWRELRDAANAYRNVKTQLAARELGVVSIQGAPREATLVLDKVSFRHPGQRDYIIRQLSISAEPGEMMLVVGPAAAGKTTLARLIVGLHVARYGQVRLGEIELSRLPVEMRAEIIGYLPQHTQLFQGSVRENIARMGAGNFEDVVAAAKLANIHEIVMRLPQGYDTAIAEDGLGLSGSERKRIGLARALYGGPRILVLDEPTANLDRESRRALEQAIVELKRQGSTIIVTNQESLAARLSRIAEKVLILGGNSIQITDGESHAKALAGSTKTGGAPRHLRPVP